ncbi:hypothetical protein GF366_00960 [Candidatus Peregrinibacteria bacterium]|nr:hypothetical protein [Candidatus Peregrinibacteria bacterium]
MEDGSETNSEGRYELVEIDSVDIEDSKEIPGRSGSNDLGAIIESTRSGIRGPVQDERFDAGFAHEDTMPPSGDTNPSLPACFRNREDSLDSQNVSVEDELRRCKAYIQVLVEMIDSICNDSQMNNDCKKGLEDISGVINLFVSKLNSIMSHCEKNSRQDTYDLLLRRQIRIVLHDLKQPLSAMLICCEDALRNWDDVDFDYIQDLLKIFRKQCNEFIDTFDQMLSYGLSIMDSTNIDGLTDSLPVLPSMILELCRQKGHEIKTEVRDRMMFVSLGPVQLNYILRELVANSMDAMDENGEVNIVFSRDGDKCKIEVSDNGMGIKPRDIVMIFEPRFSTKTGGGGIGLTEIKRILRNCGGTVQVSSMLNKGTTVTIWLPIRQNDSDWRKFI